MGQRGNQNEGLKIPQDKRKQIHKISKIHEIQQKNGTKRVYRNKHLHQNESSQRNILNFTHLKKLEKEQSPMEDEGRK